MNTKTISSAKELWHEIKRVADFTTADYDKEFFNSICEQLSITQSDLEEEMFDEKAITCEELFLAVCRALEPFSEMLCDLLEMFEQAGAQQSDRNLNIALNIKDDEPLKFNIDAFKKKIVELTYTLQYVNTYIIENPWEIIRLFSSNNNRIICKNENVRNWLRIYYEEDRWPEKLPDQPKTNYSELNKKIKLFWKLIEYSINKYREAYDESIGKRASISLSWRNQTSEIQRLFWQHETDFWVGSLIDTITFTVENISNVDEAKKLEDKIDQFLHKLRVERKLVDVETEKVIEIFNLPYWEKRYEMYSVWVCTQIIKALDGTGIVFNVINNTLSFSFKGSHIATCTHLHPNIFIFAELRTAYDKPIGKGRKANIQPDYTLAFPSLDFLQSTVAVVECKQYKKSNNTNFKNAIIDYANGRPNSHVFLVNYGPISATVQKNLPDNISDRSELIEYVKPTSDNCEHFQQLLRNKILSKCSLSNCISAEETDSAQCYINLKWSEYPKDLDLVLRIKDSVGKFHYVTYVDKGNLDNIPYARLDQDCTDGNGNETITISRWCGIEYDVFINNYSSENVIGNYADITIQIDKQIITSKIKIPIDKEQYYHLCNMGKDRVNFVNRIEHQI